MPGWRRVQLEVAVPVHQRHQPGDAGVGRQRAPELRIIPCVRMSDQNGLILRTGRNCFGKGAQRGAWMGRGFQDAQVLFEALAREQIDLALEMLRAT